MTRDASTRAAVFLFRDLELDFETDLERDDKSGFPGLFNCFPFWESLFWDGELTKSCEAVGNRIAELVAYKFLLF